MTANTGAPWSLVYQEYSDIADIGSAVQDLAVSADTAVQSLYDEQALGAAKAAGRLAATAAQAIPNNADTTLTFPAGSEYFDNDNMVDNAAPTDRITFQRTGLFLIAARVTFSGVAGAGVRRVSVTHSGAPGLIARNTQLGVNGSSAAISIVTVAPVLNVGEFVTFQAFQTSGLAISVATRQVQAFRLSPL